MGQTQSCLGDVHGVCGVSVTEIKIPHAPKALPTLLTGASARNESSKQHVDAKPTLAEAKLGESLETDERVAAARIIQAAYRGAVSRCHLKRTVEAEEEAAVTIQCAYRAYLVRRSSSKTLGKGKAGKEKRHRSKEEKKLRKTERKAAKEAVQPFLTKHGFQGVKAKRQRFWRASYPLHVAVREKEPETIKLLLKAQANPEQVDSSGKTPLLLAERLNRAGSYALVMDAFKPTAEKVLTRCSSQIPLPETEA